MNPAILPQSSAPTQQRKRRCVRLDLALFCRIACQAFPFALKFWMPKSHLALPTYIGATFGWTPGDTSASSHGALERKGRASDHGWEERMGGVDSRKGACVNS